jgi:hypothetical protein
MKFWISLLIFASLGCSQNSDTTNNTPAPGTDNPNTVAAVPELLGTWTKPCASGGGSTGFSKNSFIVDADKLQIQASVFQSSSDCTGTADLETRAQFKYSVANYVTGQVNPIDMTLQQVLARMNTAQGILVANAANFCGFNDWKITVDKDVTGRNCVAHLPSAGEPYYQIFKISDSDLFIGEVNTLHTGRTPESRPVALETTPYKKVRLGL